MKRVSAREMALARLRAALEGAEARELAAHAEINEVTISRWKTGEQPFNPNLSTLERLARGLRTTVADLVSAPGESFDERIAGLTLDERVALLRRLVSELPQGQR
jgi:transcriptional regulator with XRE-family HTH domain